MVVLQTGIIIFLIIVLAIIYQDDYRKKKLARKSARVNRFWHKDKERRKSIRINTKIDVLYEVVSGNAVKIKNSLSRNISVSGINLTLNEKLFPETTLRLQLNIPENPRPIFTQGKIIWVREMLGKFSGQKDQRDFATGIKFTQLTPKDEAILRGFIQQKIKKVPEQITPYDAP